MLLDTIASHVATHAGGDAGGAGSEDCLKVNVYTPATAKKGDKCTASRHRPDLY